MPIRLLTDFEKQLLQRFPFPQPAPRKMDYASFITYNKDYEIYFQKLEAYMLKLTPQAKKLLGIKDKKPLSKDISLCKMSDIYKYQGLSKYTGLTGKIPCRADTTFVGVEIELERVIINGRAPGTWKTLDDGSLKIAGVEFVTIPIQFKYLEIEMERLLNSLEHYDATSRCSVHVHINARDFTIEELKTFIVLYMIFERSLYRITGDRWLSNFCVPLRFNPNIVEKLFYYLDKQNIDDAEWYKYFGLNISPIWGGESHKLGTVEFRHMEGTISIPRIIKWINLIVSLKISAKKIKYVELIKMLDVMNADSSYVFLTSMVFKEYGGSILNQKTFKEDVEDGIAFSKSVIYMEKSKKEEVLELTNVR